jgi:hypothetical protein
MNKIAKIAVLLLLMVSCDDVLLRDISEDTITLHSPTEGFETSVKDVIFWWDKLDGATTYQLIVASPDVDNPQLLALDTVITKNQFTAKLAAGSFQWCVRGVSSEYRTEYACRSFSVKE